MRAAVCTRWVLQDPTPRRRSSPGSSARFLDMKTPVIAYPQSSRIVAALLTTISRGSLLVLLTLLMFFETRLSNQLRLLRVFSIFCLAPGIAAWLVERAFAATAMIRSGALVLQRRGQRIEIPCDAID